MLKMYLYPQKYDVIVIGGGHAGVEAAGAASRMGMKTLLVTQSIDTIGVMSCNPAIGGLGKTHLVKEVDALDGYMALAADQAAIHKRVLNASKGAAVQAVRYQACRDLYRQAIRRMVEATPGLDIFQAEVSDLFVEGDEVRGVDTKTNTRILGKAVVMTTGTFLAGKIHIGDVTQSGGRQGDNASDALATYLGKVFQVGRLKTGTPARIAMDSIDFSQLEKQETEADAPAMSYLPQDVEVEQLHCYITHTNEKAHEIIRKHMHASPIFQKKEELMGPRYCPSIEQKVDRFPEKDHHQIFVEPEGIGLNEVYPNGISTSLPFSAQVDFIRTIKGFENAVITRAGYAISYGYFDPRGLKPSLETKQINKLFFAGQINGTTGYEEAAAQGIIAGINAARLVQGKPAYEMERSDGYIGVLIDDLVTNGTIEPYRMFTSRAEHRLKLRCDNAHFRLTKIGYDLGVVSENRYQETIKQQKDFSEAVAFLEQKKVSEFPTLQALYPNDAGKKLSEWIKMPEVPLNTLIEQEIIPKSLHTVYTMAAIELRYAGYIAKQETQIKRLAQSSKLRIPEGFNYHEVKGLSSELLEKLTKVCPQTLGQASRIAGMTPSALSLISVYIKRHQQITTQ